jgi:hypothetical protein
MSVWKSALKTPMAAIYRDRPRSTLHTHEEACWTGPTVESVEVYVKHGKKLDKTWRKVNRWTCRYSGGIKEEAIA